MVVSQRTLLGGGEPHTDGDEFERVRLDARSWVDVGRGWMYERMVDDPRLSHCYRDGDAVPHPVLVKARDDNDSLVAILTLGEQRPFLIRPRGGGTSRDFAPAAGDLLVMGGRCQRDWEHGVPKVARAGARLSITWRWAGAVE